MKITLSDGSQISLEANIPNQSHALYVLAHGAGAGYQHPFMVEMAAALVDRNVAVARFNFPYMEAGRKSPGSPKKNISAWLEVMAHLSESYQKPIFIGGKSYGGRMASHAILESQTRIHGLIYLGFPLHAPGKDGMERAQHLQDIAVPQLFIQGSNDALANPKLMNEVVNGLEQAEIHMHEAADHSLKPKGLQTPFDLIADQIDQWIRRGVVDAP